MDLLEEVEKLQGSGVCHLGTALLGKGGYVYVACCCFLCPCFFSFLCMIAVEWSLYLPKHLLIVVCHILLPVGFDGDSPLR